MGQVLIAAEGLESPELARSLLEPCATDALAPDDAPALGALVDRYGAEWFDALLTGWSGSAGSHGNSISVEQADGFAALPRLCHALAAGPATGGATAARLLLADRWRALSAALTLAGGALKPSLRNRLLETLAPPLHALLTAAALATADEVHDAAVQYLCAGNDGTLLPCLLALLRADGRARAPEPAAAQEQPMSRSTAAAVPAPGLDAVRRCAIELLEARLAAPARAGDDWSIHAPSPCDCDLCGTLGSFLAAPDRREFEWKLASEKRRHVHDAIERGELPVTHVTRRTGRPFTLVLTKTRALFDRAAAERQGWQSDLDWLRNPARA